MKATITTSGKLIVTPESELEEYALEAWSQGFSSGMTVLSIELPGAGILHESKVRRVKEEPEA